LKELGYGNGTGAPFGIAGPRDMDPKIVKVLHDAFKKGMEDPAYQKILDKYDMPVLYKNSADYTKEVKELCDEEKVTVEKLGLGQKKK
jgi:tripartite-type tricarboxylate transporter receptor subunit TctC